MNIIVYLGVGLTMCVLLVTVRQMRPELSLLLSIACGTVLVLWILRSILPLIEEARSLASAAGMQTSLLAIAVKAVGLSIAVQTAADVCRDAGETALAGKLELGGRVALLILALPLFRQMLELSAALMGA